MRTPTPWKPNTSGAPDPFFNTRREYLEKLNDLAFNRPDFIPWESLLPFDPDTFHPTAGYAVPKSERGQIKDVGVECGLATAPKLALGGFTNQSLESTRPLTEQDLIDAFSEIWDMLETEDVTR